MQKWAKIGGFFGVLFFFPAISFSVDFYVATNGSDANDCVSLASPCQTIQAAIDKSTVTHGDTGHIAAGTYTLSATVNYNGKNIVLTGAGQPRGATMTRVIAPDNQPAFEIGDATANQAINNQGGLKNLVIEAKYVTPVQMKAPITIENNVILGSYSNNQFGVAVHTYGTDSDPNKHGRVQNNIFVFGKGSVSAVVPNVLVRNNTSVYNDLAYYRGIRKYNLSYVQGRFVDCSAGNIPRYNNVYWEGQQIPYGGDCAAYANDVFKNTNVNPGIIHEVFGKIQALTSNTIQVAGANWSNGQWNGYFVTPNYNNNYGPPYYLILDTACDPVTQICTLTVSGADAPLLVPPPPTRSNFHAGDIFAITSFQYGSNSPIANVDGDNTQLGTDIYGNPRTTQALGAVAPASQNGPRLNPTTLYVDDDAADGTLSQTKTCVDPLSPCATIDYALSQAIPGDQIRVAGGRYPTNGLSFGGRQLVLEGPGFTWPDVAIIDAVAGRSEGISFNNAESNAARFSNFVLKAQTNYGVLIGGWAAPIVENLIVIGGYDVGINAMGTPGSNSPAIIRNILTGGRPHGIDASRDRRVVNNTVFGAVTWAYNLEAGYAFNNLAYGSNIAFRNCSNQHQFANNNAFGTLLAGKDFDMVCGTFPGNTTVDPSFVISYQGRWEQLIGTDTLRDNDANFQNNELRGKWININIDDPGIKNLYFYIIGNTPTNIQVLAMNDLSNFASRFGNRNYHIIDWTPQGTGVWDAGDNQQAPATDLLGNGRPFPVAGTVDIGAMEFVTPPEISINSISHAETEAATQTNFTVSLNQAYSKPVRVNYQTIDGTALAGQDYEATSGALTFQIGETTKNIPVTIFGNQVHEPTKTFEVRLSQPVNGMIQTGVGVATINDNDAEPSVGFTSSFSNPTEGDGLISIAVNLSGASSQEIRVNYVLSGGSATPTRDYLLQADTLRFASGETGKQISIQLVEDTEVEQNETIELGLTSLVGATLGQATHQVHIQDNDSLPLPPPAPAPAPPPSPAPPPPPPPEKGNAQIIGPSTLPSESEAEFQLSVSSDRNQGNVSYLWSVTGEGSLVGSVDASYVRLKTSSTSGTLQLSVRLQTGTQSFDLRRLIRVLPKKLSTDSVPAIHQTVVATTREGSLIVESLDGDQNAYLQVNKNFRIYGQNTKWHSKTLGSMLVICDENANQKTGMCWLVDQQNATGKAGLEDEEGSGFKSHGGKNPGDRFGHALEITDLDNNGHHEIFIHSPGTKTIEKLDDQFNTLATLTEKWGLQLDEIRLASGNIQGRDNKHLIVAGQWNGRGKVLILGEEESRQAHPNATITIDGDDPFSSVDVGDVNGDGIFDLVLSSEQACSAFIFLGGHDFQSKKIDEADALIYTLECPSGFGSQIQVADVSGDGLADILILIPQSADGGWIHIIYGSETIRDVNLNDDGPHSLIMGQTGFVLGEEVFTVKDLDGDGVVEIVVSENQPNGEKRTLVFLTKGKTLQGNVIVGVDSPKPPPPPPSQPLPPDTNSSASGGCSLHPENTPPVSTLLWIFLFAGIPSVKFAESHLVGGSAALGSKTNLQFGHHFL